jgi:MFS family permease
VARVHFVFSAAGQAGDLRALLRRPRYPGFVLTVTLSRLTATMFTISGVLLVLSRTGSASLAGITAAASVLPGAISGPFLGAVLDVAERRRVLMVFDQLTSVVALLAIVALAGHAPNWTVPAMTVIYSVTRPFSSGSFYSAMAVLAGPELLDQASAIEASSLNFAYIAGPALAGAVAGVAGAAAAVEVQVAITLVSTVLVAINPAFEARSEERAESAIQALGEGLRALLRTPMLRASGGSATLAAFGWGLMAIGFPLYALSRLNAGAHAGGYLWAAMAFGSLLGTFALAGRPSRRRVAISYAVLGMSALLWPLAHSLWPGIVLVGLTGFLEGPAFSGTVALRQRYTPQAVRAQVMMTLNGVALIAAAGGSVIAGAIGRLAPLIIAFTLVNLLASLTAARG